MKKGSYDSVLYQHDSEPLVYAMWPDNNIVRTLSNFHLPSIIKGGIHQRRKVNGVRKRDPMAVPCPIQNQYYSETFHLIDKGNGCKAKYNIGMESHSHGWTPKLAFRYFNMNLNNAYKIYDALHTLHTPQR